MSGEARQLNPVQARALDLVSFLAVNLVDHPQDVMVDLVSEEGRDVVSVHVHPEDQGQFIGKGGQTARAIRTLLSAVSARTGTNIVLDIAD